MQGESEKDMTVNEIKKYIFDKVCLYSKSTLETLWVGEIAGAPEKYLDCEITVIGVKRKGGLDIGVNEAIPASEGDRAAG